MQDREPDNEAVTKSCRLRRLEEEQTAEQETLARPVLQPDLLAQVRGRPGDVAKFKSHAAALNRVAGGQPSRAWDLLRSLPLHEAQ